jgi:branched-chain amino acid transport system substrate-binding protein
VGLTSNGLGSSPGEPEAYYPTALRTFARVVPSDYVQAEAQVTLQRQLGCRATYVLSDGEYDGDSASEAFLQVAKQRHLDVVTQQSYVPNPSSYKAIGQTIAADGADCVLIAAITGRGAARLVTEIAKENPAIRLFATDGLAETSFSDPFEGGVPTKIDHRLLITAPTGNPSAAGPLGSTFTKRYEQRYGTPEPAAIDGYEAMSLTLDAIESNGNTSLDSYDVYKVSDGSLQYWKTVRG